MKFAGYDAIVVRGQAPSPSALVVGTRRIDVEDVHYLWTTDALDAGKKLRKIFPDHSGHRSILRIGPAGENRCAYACITVDTYRHFGRMGSGAVMGGKNLKAIVVQGDANFDLPQGKEYAKLFREVYREMTATDMMYKYHALGTPQNLIPLNELKALPWRNLQATSDPEVDGISGETFARDVLLRNAACAGCPVGCIHVGMIREMFQDDYRYHYRQVPYDYEPIFACGSMLGVTDASRVLAIMDEVEKVGLDVMSAGCALAWATEATEKGLISEEETIVPLAFGDANGYEQAVHHLAGVDNDFYRVLAKGSDAAAEVYGGLDFTPTLGQEMAGYATGEVFYTAQSMGLRHSHLDSGGYSFDQKHEEQDVDKAIDFLVKDEAGRCMLTSMVSCLFARGVYSDEKVAECLRSIGWTELAEVFPEASHKIQRKRWAVKVRDGYDPHATRVPKRYLEVETWKGKTDPGYLEDLRKAYGGAILELAESGKAEAAAEREAAEAGGEEEA
jgi:aldehyde:ferredoxin oxidoreductase